MFLKYPDEACRVADNAKSEAIEIFLSEHLALSRRVMF
jgi:hypothetical protein